MKKIFKITFFIFVVLTFTQIYGYNQTWDVENAINAEGKDVLRIKMSAGVSEASKTLWNRDHKYKVGSDGYYEETKTLDEICGGQGDYASKELLFHNQKMTNYMTHDELQWERWDWDTRLVVPINCITDEGEKTYYVSRQANSNPDLSTNTFASIPSGLTLYKYKISGDTNIFIRELSLDNLRLICSTLGLNMDVQNKIWMSTRSCTNDTRFSGRDLTTAWQYYAAIVGNWSIRTLRLRC